MATHHPASARTPGRTVHPRTDRIVQELNFRAYPLLAVGGLCAIASLALSGPERSTESDAGRPAMTSGKRTARHASDADPARALDHALALGKGSDRQTLIRDLLSEWAVRDAEAALGWVASLEDSAARRSARSTVCMVVAETDPRRAVTLALAHGADEGDDGGLLECLTMQWCEKEAGAVLDWAREQPPGEWRERLLGRASFVLSKSDPVAAALLVSGLEPGAVQDEAAMAVLHQWALTDSAAALQWAEGFAETSLRDRALAEITNLRNWAASSQAVE